MGSRESTTRKVSFGVDEEDRVRILRGIKLSEDVLQRMRGVANIAPGSPSSSCKDTGTLNHVSAGPQAQPQHSPHSDKPSTDAKKEPRRSEHSTLKDDLAQKAQREEMSRGMSWERHHIREEAKKAQQLSPDDVEAMAQQLQKKDSQLKALDAFYREQLAQMEKRNWEKYEEGKEKFHQAASKAEENVRSRNTSPVCSGLQAQILSCYSDNKDHTLKCSGLAKEYLQCINAAKKNLLINHG